MKLVLALLPILGACGAGVHGDPRIHTGDPDAAVDGAAAMTGACNDPEGPRHPYTQAAEVEQLVLGRWLHCSGATLLGQAGEVGIELTADHIYYVLQQDGDQLVREGGFAGSGTWDTYQETPTSVQFDYHPTPNSGNGGYFLFEDSPRRFAINIGYNDTPSIYVLLP
jgi:hypothetical protein